MPNFRYYLPTELPNFHLQSDISKVDIPFRELVARPNLPQVLIAQLPSISAQHPGLRSQHHTLVRIDVCFQYWCVGLYLFGLVFSNNMLGQRSWVWCVGRKNRGQSVFIQAFLYRVNATQSFNEVQVLEMGAGCMRAYCLGWFVRLEMTILLLYNIYI